MATLIDAAPFLAAIAVQLVSIPVQAWVAANLKRFHRNKETTGPSISSTPEDIRRRFIVDSDYIAATAAVVTFVVSAILVLVSKEKFDPWTLSTYILLGIVFLGACTWIYQHYRGRYGLYRDRSIFKKRIMPITPSTVAVVVINLVGVIGLILYHPAG